MADPSRYRFSGFSFNAETGELTGPAGGVRLEPQPARVLGLLLARAGELVTRDELRTALWADRAVEADQGINYCIREIRIALGDTGQEGRFIETLPRRGYRFVASLEPTDVAPAGVEPVGRRRWIAGVVAAGAIVCIGLIGFGAARGRDDSSPRRMIAVLPLRTSDADSLYAGINRQFTELLVERLANDTLARFDVVGPATTARLAGDPRPHAELGRALGVELVLSGGMSTRDTMMFVQIVRVSDGAHVFAWRRHLSDRSIGEEATELLLAIDARLRVTARPN